MSENMLGDGNSPTDDVFACIADQSRRTVLSILQERTARVSTAELATIAVATLTDKSLVDVTREERDQFRVELYHTHLPKLADADLVEWNREDGTVATTDLEALHDDRIQQLIDVTADDWDTVLRAIQTTRRRIALSVIESADSIDRNTLANRVAKREADQLATQDSSVDTESVSATLHHVHLPKLQQAGLIVYDDETARYAGHADLEPDWLDHFDAQNEDFMTQITL